MDKPYPSAQRTSRCLACTQTVRLDAKPWPDRRGQQLRRGHRLKVAVERQRRCQEPVVAERVNLDVHLRRRATTPGVRLGPGTRRNVLPRAP